MQAAADASALEVLLAAHAAPGMPPLVLPGCWDGLSARMVQRAGYQAAWIDRAAVATARFGSDDRDLVTATMMASIVADMLDVAGIALAVDAGNGFGNAFNVGRTVTMLETAGAQAIQLEDELASGRAADPKRATADMIGKVKAAVDVADQMLLIARTGRRPREGLNALMDRASAYAEAGADLIAIAGPVSTADLGRLTGWAQQRVPLMVASDEPFDAARFADVAVVCQPLLLQEQLSRAAAGLLPAPPRAVYHEEPEARRRLAS